VQTRLLPLALLPFLAALTGESSVGGPDRTVGRPYRVLVVIGDQWTDAGSYCIDTRSRFPDLPARQSGKDFLDVVTMLKIWGIPFDILRLDQQRLQINRFLNGIAEPNYACVIWLADPDTLRGYSAHYETLRRVVEDYGISLKWHYPTPSKEEIVKYLVEPLEARRLVMVQNVTPGYANPLTRMVENPWTVPKFTDPFGNVQDYASTKAGLDEGVRRGVFEIHAHRAWTHMTWDLDSPPGPWWDAPIEGERAHPDWYNETVDTRRHLPVPSSDMLFIYKVGRDAIQRQFGVTPLGVTVRPGSGLEHDNGRLAVIAGYGVGRWHYLGPDHVIQFSIPGMAPEEFGCHDLDLLAKSDSEITGPGSELEKEPVRSKLRSTRIVGGRSIDLRNPDWTRRWKDKRWMGFNEYCAYLHSRVDVVEAGGLRVQFYYDPHFCRHFAKHSSRWTLELSDRYQAKLGRKVSLVIDGQTETRALARQYPIVIPEGVGERNLVIRSE
jgi:hypothetical protein